MRSIAYITALNYQKILKRYPQFLDEFNVFKAIFSKYEINLVQQHWQDQNVNWQSYAGIFLKSCWDYVKNPIQFELFLNHINDLNLPMINHYQTIRWNMRKTYLLDLQRQGLSITELLIIPKHSNILDLENMLSQVFDMHLTDDMLIAKPSVGMGSSNTIRFNIKELKSHYHLFNKILSYADLIIQPYSKELATSGEYSYIFYNNEFSHAVLKTPKSGDYRCHLIFGAHIAPYEPSLAEIDQAYAFISKLNPQCLYARIDGFKHDNKLILVELELIEPYLYLEYAEVGSLDRLCKAIIDCL